MLEKLKMLFFYGLYNLVLLGPLLGLILFAIKRSNRVCNSLRWPRALALGFGIFFVLANLVLFAVEGGASLWFFLNLPFSLLLEFNGSFGFPFFTITTTLVCAAFWSTCLYVIAALIIRLSGRVQPQ